MEELRTFRVTRHRYRNGLDVDIETIYRGTSFHIEEQKEWLCLRILNGTKTVAFVRNFESIEDASGVDQEREL